MNSLDRRDFLMSSAAGLAALPARGASGAEGHPGPSSAEDPLGVRASFPVARELAYLNTASSGPLPVPVRDALTAYAHEKTLHRDPGTRREALARARRRFASLFGADEEEIAFLHATSAAENVVVRAMDWRRGDNVVVDELHFTTTFVLYRELERREGVELRIVPAVDGAVRPADFARRMDARTRLVSVAWVSNRNGFRHDLPALADLAHDRGAYLYADAIQAWGAFPTNLREERVDFACGNGYKWLHADYGCAPFYARREHLDWLTSDRHGHVQVESALPGHRFRLRTDARRFEYANPAHGPVAAMDAALEFLAQVGLGRIADHTQELAAQLRRRVHALGMAPFTPPHVRSPIVSFRHGLEPGTLARALDDEGVRVTFQEDGALLRTAVGMFNDGSDVDRLVRTLAALA